MRIGELSKLTETPIDTIRFYERIGLLAAPRRSAANYRSYDPAHVARLRFVRRCRSLDMPLEDIRRLIAFCDTPEQNCAEVNALLAAQLDRVRQRVRALRALASELEQLQGVCNEPGLARQCRILMTLSTTKRRGSP